AMHPGYTDHHFVVPTTNEVAQGTLRAVRSLKLKVSSPPNRSLMQTDETVSAEPNREHSRVPCRHVPGGLCRQSNQTRSIATPAPFGYLPGARVPRGEWRGAH